VGDRFGRCAGRLHPARGRRDEHRSDERRSDEDAVTGKTVTPAAAELLPAGTSVSLCISKRGKLPPYELIRTPDRANRAVTRLK
jgi:hypothetical protein